MQKVDIAIIGGGAAGFFAAINTALLNPKLTIVILEKSDKLLSKVKISGGGRCNVTHHCFENGQLVKNYPRGEKELRSVFNEFNPEDTINWFKQFGVKIIAENDGRMFPESNTSQTIIDCFLNLTQQLGIKIYNGFDVKSIEKLNDDLILTSNNTNSQIVAKKVLIASGGFPKEHQFNFIKALGHNIITPMPSLFTFNLPGNSITQLMGVSVNPVTVKIKDFKTESTGPLLITHWGLSGPAILKLSAFAARFLGEKNYEFEFKVNWLNNLNFDEAKDLLIHLKNSHSKGEIINYKPEAIPSRLWEFFIYTIINIPNGKKWGDISNKELNQLIETLTNSTFKAKGKTTFKDEFVTCGGVDLKEINLKTLESKLIPNLYFAGEVINVDGVTGGFNFQNAWSTAFIAAKSLST